MGHLASVSAPYRTSTYAKPEASATRQFRQITKKIIIINSGKYVDFGFTIIVKALWNADGYDLAINE